VSMSKFGITKALRLAQITSGFLGGLESIDADEDDPVAGVPNDLPPWLRKAQGLEPAPVAAGPFNPLQAPVAVPKPVAKMTREIGREKLDALLRWLSVNPKPRKLVVWCRFRPELLRTTNALRALYPTVLNLKGGQSPEERSAVKSFLAPGGDPREGAVVGITGTGAASLNFSAAWMMWFMSHDPALIKRTQSIGRIERPGQSSPMLIGDVVATGPKGQKTIDHHTLHALRGKDDMARWTVGQWRKILAEE